MDKGISNFSDEIYYERKLFCKNNEIQIKRMFSTAFEKPKSARSLKEKWIKYLKGFSIELICLFFMINSSVLLNVFYSVDLEIWPSYECFNLQVSSFFIKSYCCYAPIVILHFFWSNLTHVSAFKLLKSLKIPTLKVA